MAFLNRDDLLANALYNADRAADFAATAGVERVKGDDFDMYVARAAAFSQASRAYSALLAATAPADFEEEGRSG